MCPCGHELKYPANVPDTEIPLRNFKMLTLKKRKETAHSVETIVASTFQESLAKSLRKYYCIDDSTWQKRSFQNPSVVFVLRKALSTCFSLCDSSRRRVMSSNSTDVHLQNVFDKVPRRAMWPLLPTLAVLIASGLLSVCYTREWRVGWTFGVSSWTRFQYPVALNRHLHC